MLESLSTAWERNHCTVRLGTMYNNYYLFRNDIIQLELTHYLVDAFNIVGSGMHPRMVKTQTFGNFQTRLNRIWQALIAISKLLTVSQNRRSRSYYYYPHRFLVYYTSRSPEKQPFRIFDPEGTLP